MFARFATQRAPAQPALAPPGAPPAEAQRDCPRVPPNEPKPDPASELSVQALRIDEESEYLKGQRTMKVGKYRGRTFEFIAKQQYYVRWVRNQRFASGALGQLKRWLDENATRLLEQQMQEALAMRGTLSRRVRSWNLEVMRDRGMLREVPTVGNATVHGSRRPRQPMYSLETAGIIPAWDPKQTSQEKWRLKALTMLTSRALSYVLRRMIHDAREEPVSEPLIADKALLVLARNTYAYKLCLSLAPGKDPDAEVDLAALEAALQKKRARIRNPAKLDRLPESLLPCMTRLGCARGAMQPTGYIKSFRDGSRVRIDANGSATELDQSAPEPAPPPRKEYVPPTTTTARKILLRFMLSMGELRQALEVYRNLGDYEWFDEPVLRACWIMARGDGAFARDRVTNEPVPPPMLQRELPIYGYMQRLVRDDFAAAPELTYGACVGFSDGCPLEADLVVGDRVVALRGGLWVSSAFDGAYLSGYAALARHHKRALNRFSIYYLQHGAVLTCDLHDWDHTPLLAYLQADDHKAAKDGSACDLGLCELPPPEQDIDEEEEERERRSKKKARQVTRRGLDALA